MDSPSAPLVHFANFLGSGTLCDASLSQTDLQKTLIPEEVTCEKCREQLRKHVFVLSSDRGDDGGE